MKATITVLVAAAALALCPATAHATAGAGARFAVPGTGSGTCVDAPLTITFPDPPTLGETGAIEVRRADGGLADRVEAATARTDRKNIGAAVSDTGLPHDFSYESIMIDGDTATVYPHHRLEYGQDYYVTVDPGVFTGFDGVQDPKTWRFTTKKAAKRQPRHLTVSAAGTGDFCTVQGAVDAVPTGNETPVTIDVRPGVYTEMVYVREDRPHITVRGAGARRTVIQYPNNDLRNGDKALSDGGPADVCPRRVLAESDLHNCWRAMFGVDAADFRMSDITLHNTTADGGSQAEAFRGNNERIALERVRLRSFQDTLRLQGKGFVTDSHISGDTDFVWGTGTVFIQDSVLESTDAGYIAQSRNDATRPGTVFVRTKLTRAPGVPDGSVALSRSAVWRFTHSQAVFIDTAMDSHIDPAGFQIDPDDCAQAQSTSFWEYRSTDLTGEPIDVSQRLACSRRLTAAEAAQWSEPSFVLGGWDPEPGRD
ncbi:Ig-like domain-containing protein [Nonomuraea sp. K274]|uniref:Ig-like domain-containing protein n=1 Tax=Nonomuraea cypriaca TaxID=1187855 RepID=A0A931EWM7_9ACTN|nr:pectinesterase family protein [Nonomuraea cypriaca]MBF8184627.1 Ig-like domain-containing protein [Nonomuraea cypriaca]